MTGTAEAAEADIGAEPVDQPVPAAAGMLLAETDDVPEAKLEDGALSHRAHRSGSGFDAVPGADQRSERRAA